MEWGVRIPRRGHFECAAVGCAGGADPSKCLSLSPGDGEVCERGFFHAGAMFGDERVQDREADMANLSL